MIAFLLALVLGLALAAFLGITLVARWLPTSQKNLIALRIFWAFERAISSLYPFRGQRMNLANTVPPPYSSGAHKDGDVTMVADAAIAVRYSLVDFGVTEASCKAHVAGGFPLGTVNDTTDTLTNDLTIPLVVNLFGSAMKTRLVAIRTNVNRGDWLIADTTNPIYGMTDPATGGTLVYRFGRALHSALANDPKGVEFDPCLQAVQH